MNEAGGGADVLGRLLIDLSARFLGLPSEQVDAAIEDAQRAIVEAFDIDRSTLWQFREDQEGLLLTHCWQRPGWAPLPRRLDAETLLPWSHSRVMMGQPFWFASLDDLPGEAARDAEAFRVHGPRASVIIPLLSGGRPFGVMAFGHLRAEREWREGEIAELKLVAQIIGNVLGRQRAELRAQRLCGDLAHSMRLAALGELGAAMAHELNQPLAAILANAQAARRFLAEGSAGLGEIPEILDDIVRDSKRIGGIIQNLRAMVNKRRAPREGCDLNALVGEVLGMMRGEMLLRKISARADLSPGLPPVDGVAVELQQVVVNLLLNAARAMEETPPESRALEIETRDVGGEVALAVRARGPGIPEDRLGNVFDAFYSTREDGLGMGLAISQRIVTDHSGRIEARNRAGGGVEFLILLPPGAGGEREARESPREGLARASG